MDGYDVAVGQGSAGNGYWPSVGWNGLQGAPTDRPSPFQAVLDEVARPNAGPGRAQYVQVADTSEPGATGTSDQPPVTRAGATARSGPASIPDPNGTVPGGPWVPQAGSNDTWYGAKMPRGPRSLCHWVPSEADGGPKGSQGYWKTSDGSSRGFQRYDQSGNPIPPEEAHPGRPTTPPASSPPATAEPAPAPEPVAPGPTPTPVEPIVEPPIIIVE